jgi:hypothetical protein
MIYWYDKTLNELDKRIHKRLSEVILLLEPMGPEQLMIMKIHSVVQSEMHNLDLSFYMEDNPIPEENEIENSKDLPTNSKWGRPEKQTTTEIEK